MQLSEQEITKHLLESANALGEVKGLISQTLENFSSFKENHRLQLTEFKNAFEKLTSKIDESQKESRVEVQRLVDGMNKKIEDNFIKTEGKVKEADKALGDLDLKIEKTLAEVKLIKRMGYSFATIVIGYMLDLFTKAKGLIL